MSHVFVSHASGDKRTTKSICNALDAEGIRAWVSFRDIAPGSNWDEEIEAALETASAVVVVVTPRSVGSRYVRAEVESAIQQQKTVIPVIAEPTRLPVRWGTLQNVRLTSRNGSAVARQIARGLPQASATMLRDALNDRSRFHVVRDVILRHPEWLPIEYRMADRYSYVIDAPVLDGSRIDCFAARMDTPGPRAFLYYLGSPYERPILASGRPSSNLEELLSTVRLHRFILGQGMRQSHRLAPRRILRAELGEWKEIFPRYTSIRVYVIIGRRRHFEGAANSAREAIVATINQELFSTEAFYGCGLEVMSYDRILDAIPQSDTVRALVGATP